MSREKLLPYNFFLTSSTFSQIDTAYAISYISSICQHFLEIEKVGFHFSSKSLTTAIFSKTFVLLSYATFIYQHFLGDRESAFQLIFSAQSLAVMVAYAMSLCTKHHWMNRDPRISWNIISLEYCSYLELVLRTQCRWDPGRPRPVVELNNETQFHNLKELVGDFLILSC